jgi:hypothetical protein
MKTFLISAAVVALTSTSAFAGSSGGSGGGMGGGTGGLFGGGFSINVSPIMTVTNQTATAVGIVVAPTTGSTSTGGTGGATNPTITNTTNAVNWSSIGIVTGSSVRY